MISWMKLKSVTRSVSDHGLLFLELLSWLKKFVSCNPSIHHSVCLKAVVSVSPGWNVQSVTSCQLAPGRRPCCCFQQRCYSVFGDISTVIVSVRILWQMCFQPAERPGCPRWPLQPVWELCWPCVLPQQRSL